MSTDTDKKRVFWMAAGLMTSAMGYIFCITFLQVPDKSRDFANLSLGFLTGSALAAVINYFFGSSQSGRDKDASIKAMAENAPKLAENLKITTDAQEQPPKMDS